MHNGVSFFRYLRVLRSLVVQYSSLSATLNEPTTLSLEHLTHLHHEHGYTFSRQPAS